MSNRCTTHFHACDCREQHFKEMQDELTKLKEQLERAKEALDKAIDLLGVPEHHQDDQWDQGYRDVCECLKELEEGK